MSNKAKGGSVPTGDVGAMDVTSESATTALTGVTPDAGKIEVSGDGDISGPLDLALSSGLRDDLVRKLQESIHRVRKGFGTLAKPSDIFKGGEDFYVVDAHTIEEYVDKRTGEVKPKHVFELEFNDGRSVMIMQGDNAPRRELATMFITARALQGKVAAGPYRFEEKQTGQVQPALIMTQQKGFEVVAQ